MHRSIDNARTGHAATILDAIVDYVDTTACAPAPPAPPLPRRLPRQRHALVAAACCTSANLAPAGSAATACAPAVLWCSSPGRAEPRRTRRARPAAPRRAHACRALACVCMLRGQTARSRASSQLGARQGWIGQRQSGQLSRHSHGAMQLRWNTCPAPHRKRLSSG